MISFRKLTAAQRRTLASLREFTDGESRMHRAGVVEIRGMIANCGFKSTGVAYTWRRRRSAW